MEDQTFDVEFTHDIPELIDTSIFPGDLEFPFEEKLPAILPVSPEIYHRTKAFSNSYSKRVLSESFHHAHVSLKQNDGMRKGSALEVCFEEGFKTLHEDEELDLRKIIEKQLAVLPAYEGKGRDAVRKKFKEDNKYKTLVASKDLVDLEEMLRSSFQNDDFKKYFHGTWQVAVFWIEEGIPCKALLDHVVCNTLTRNRYKPLDLKSTRNKGYKGFQDDIKEYKYDMQVAHYDSALCALYGQENVDVFSFAVVESRPPYATAYYDVSQRMYDAGYLKRAYVMKQVKDFMNGRLEVKEYPVFERQEIDIPEWYYDDALNYKEMNYDEQFDDF